MKRAAVVEDNTDNPLLALTAHAMAGDRERYIAAGFDEYVTKPILDESLLLDALDRFTGPA